MDPAPPQGEDVETTIEIRRVAVEQRGGAVPLRKHGGIPRPALHPDVVDRDTESGQDAAEALKPAAQIIFVMALTTKRMGAGNAVMNTRRDGFHRLVPAVVVDVVEGLSDLFFDYVTV